jgi:hypothetical protein
VGLEGQHAAGHAAVAGLAVEQRQHGLVAAVHAVEVADGDRAAGREAGMLETAEDAHGARLSGPLRRQCRISVATPVS